MRPVFLTAYQNCTCDGDDGAADCLVCRPFRLTARLLLAGVAVCREAYFGAGFLVGSFRSLICDTQSRNASTASPQSISESNLESIFNFLDGHVMYYHHLKAGARGAKGREHNISRYQRPKQQILEHGNVRVALAT